LRYILSAVHNAEIDKGKGATLTEEEMVGLLQSQAKQRRESIKAYMEGGRDDLVEKEGAELEVIQSYLPEQLSEDKVRQMAEETVKEVGASGPSDMGKVMGALMPKIKSRADGSIVSRIVTELLK
jgi:uncharacterized protein YqeY